MGEGGVGERLAVGADGIPFRALEALQVGVGRDIIPYIYPINQLSYIYQTTRHHTSTLGFDSLCSQLVIFSLELYFVLIFVPAETSTPSPRVRWRGDGRGPCGPRWGVVG